MINSSKRKLALAGWLQVNDIISYNVPLKLQKFIFFYECACKVNEKPYEFDRLKGYKNGPVFSAVWGDYTKDRHEFDTHAKEECESNTIDNNIALKIGFFIKTCTEEELSEITRTMNIWNAKKDRILSNEYQVPLDDDDFNSEDKQLINNILSVYPLEVINNSEVITIKNKVFILSKKDSTELSPQQWDTLNELSNLNELENPIHIAIDKEKKGRLLVD